jgi:CheY-like chemotaxis protein
MADDTDWRVWQFLDRMHEAGGQALTTIAEALDLPLKAVLESLDRLARTDCVRRVREGDESWIATPTLPRRLGDTPAAPATGPTIAIADDDTTALATYARFLKLEGFRVVTAHDVTAAMQLLESVRPDAILIDLKFPEVGDGLGLLRHVRAGGHSMPAAIMTGHYGMDDDTETEIRRLHACIAYKPLWFENMLELVRDLLAVGPQQLNDTDQQART